MQAVGLTLEVTYESAAGLLEDFRNQILVGGLFAEVSGADQLEPLQPLTVRLVVAASEQPAIEAPARLTVATPQSICVEILSEARAALATEVAIACGEVADADPKGRLEARLYDPELDAPEADAPPDAPKERPRLRSHALPLEKKLLAMSVSEKVQMALHGTREERMQLMKDRAGVVQASLVRNPKTTLDEVTALARASHLAPDAADAIAEHITYGTSPQVALALARNPRTPLKTAVEMVGKLNTSDLRMLAKGLGVRMQIAQAARKRLFDGHD